MPGRRRATRSYVDGAEAFPLTSARDISAPGFPRWSPDGTLIAFHGNPRDRSDVLLVSAQGGTPRILTTNVSNGAMPTFSRDGRWIYFAQDEGAESRIWKMPAAGGRAVRVTTNPGAVALESLDGRDLYYVEAWDRPSPLWRMPLNGGVPVRVLGDVFNSHFAVVEKGIYYLELVRADTSTIKSPALPAVRGGNPGVCVCGSSISPRAGRPRSPGTLAWWAAV
jgi:dipeptidyl aminopeptidase/acylaminoacyl peptidase